MKSLKSTLQRRFIFIVLLHTLITLCSIYLITLYNISKSLNWEISRFEAEIIDILKEDIHKDQNYNFLALQVGEESNFSFSIKFKDGRIIEGGNAEYFSENMAFEEGVFLQSYKKVVEFKKIDKPHYELFTVASSELDLIDDVLWIFLLSLPLILAPALYLSYKTFDQVVSPLNEVSDSLSQINSGNLTTRLKTEGYHEEIDQLLTELNDTFTQLEKLFMKSERFNAFAAHELKTPLTAIKGEIDVCLSGEDKKDAYENCLLKVQKEVHNYKGLIDSLLLISSPGDELKKSFERINLTEVIEEIRDLAEVMAEANNVFLKFEIKSGEIIASKKMMIQAFFNLIENAMKYSNVRSNIIIKINESSFSVHDSAEILTESDRKKIIEPFYRKDSRAEGYGLGLSMVEWVCRAHDYKLEISSNEDGNIFAIQFN